MKLFHRFTIRTKIIFSASTLLIFYSYFTPYISIISFKLALESENFTKANKYIDYKLLRQSIKNQIKVPLLNKLNENKNSPPFSLFGSLMIEPIVNGIDQAAINRMKWFDSLSAGKQHTDFFANRVTNYSKGVTKWDANSLF